MRKIVVSLILISLICSLALASIANFGEAQNGTTVSGVMATSTTWTPANSPYTLTGNVLVSNGITLTIQPGTTVNLSGYYIQVNGTLQAIGDNANQIIINGGNGGYITFAVFSTAWNDATSSGSIIQNANISASLTLYNSTKICNSTISASIQVPDSYWYPTVMPQITNNRIQGGISVGTNENASIINNIITGTGITLSLSSGTVNPGQAIIRDNTISGCSTGIMVGGGGSWPTQVIQDNLIVNNSVGIDINTFIWTSPPVIQNNTISRNGVGINIDMADQVSNPINPAIDGNNLCNNTDYNVKDQTPEYVYAANNWWGTTDTQAINQTIYGYYNDFNLGAVSFTPFLLAPNTQAPTYANATAGAGGSITPNGIIRLTYGSNQSFSITPKSGYHVADVLVNGSSVGAVSSYSLQNVTGASSVSATFAPDATPTPTPTATPTTNPTATPTEQPTSTPTSTPTQSPPPTTNPTSTPTQSPAPTPTAPELSILILLPMLGLILFGAVAVKLKGQANKK